MTLIVTIMGASTSEERFKASAALLDYGFASYAMAGSEEEDLPLVTVKKGKLPTAEVECENGFRIVVPKGYEKKLDLTVTMADEIIAPAQKGQQVGLLTYKLEDKTVKTFPIVLKDDVEKAGVIDYFKRFFGKLV
jgi:D-alanyl-D-alanine carboxypeptidase (penicillin-binding protein 5/6)